jgi:hypothetical protein
MSEYDKAPVKLECRSCPMFEETLLCALRDRPVSSTNTCPFGTLLFEHRAVLQLLSQLYDHFSTNPSTLLDEANRLLRRTSYYQRHIDRFRTGWKQYPLKPKQRHPVTEREREKGA